MPNDNTELIKMYDRYVGVFISNKTLKIWFIQTRSFKDFDVLASKFMESLIYKEIWLFLNLKFRVKAVILPNFIPAMKDIIISDHL